VSVPERDLPPGWAWAAIDELTEFVTSGSRGWARYYADTGPLFLRVGNLDRATIELSLRDVVRIQPPVGAEGRRTRVQPGDILLSITADVGMVGLASKAISEAYVNQHVALLRPLPSVFPSGLAYALLDPAGLQALARRVQYGMTKPGLSLIQVRRFPVRVPPLQEQHRIVDAIDSHLTRLDEAVALLERVRRNLGRYRAAVLDAAVQGRLVPTDAELARREGRDYEPASVLLERILAERRRRWEEAELTEMIAAGRPPKDDRWKRAYKEPTAPGTSGLPRPPEGWCYTQLPFLLPAGRQGMKTGPFGTLLKKHEHVESGIPVLGIENIEPMRFVSGSKIHITATKAAQLSAYDIRPPDLIISRSGTVGEVCVVPEHVGDARFSTNVMRVRLIPDEPVPSFFALLLNGSRFVRDQISALCGGTTRDFLNQRILSSIIFPVPPKEEQRRIVDAVRDLLSIADALQAQVQRDSLRCQHLRKSVLKWAFEGKLVDQDPSDEPASILLERIGAERAAGTPAAGPAGRARGSRRATA